MKGLKYMFGPRTRLFRRRYLAPRQARPSRSTLQLEILEDRTLLTTGLVAAYAFDEGSGITVTDASGNGNAGTISNASWVQGKYGTGLSFSGATNSYVSIADAPRSAAGGSSSNLTVQRPGGSRCSPAGR